MPLVTVKSKFQVTIPSVLRKGIRLREGDMMTASVVDEGILLKPVDVIDRSIDAADSLGAIFAKSEISKEDRNLSEEEIMEDAIAEVKASRQQRRARAK